MRIFEGDILTIDGLIRNNLHILTPRWRLTLEAVRNAVLEPWSNGQTEGQINKLKTLKRAMYGRAGIELLRARMMPLQERSLHQE